MGVILAILGTIFLGLLGRWLAAEISVWHKPLCRRLVRFAAACQPAEERAALECEWLAVIDDIKSPAAQLLHSVSYVVSAMRVRDAIEVNDSDMLLRRKIRAFHMFVAGVGGGIGMVMAQGYRVTLLSRVTDFFPLPKPAMLLVGIFAFVLALASARLSEAILISLVRRRRLKRLQKVLEE